VLFLGASFMAHAAALAAGTLAAIGALETARRGRLTWSLGGGVALGALVLIRPFEGVLVGLVCATMVLDVLRMRALTVGAALFASAAVLVGGITLAYNRALTGRALLDPITQYFDREHYPGSNRLGFGPDVGNVGWANDALPGHTPFEAAINANWNASLVQIELFGWGFGSLLVVTLVLAQWQRLPHRRPFLGALLAVAFVAAAYTLYWYSAADFGARYWSQMIVPLAALTAAALFALPAAATLRRVAVIASLLGAPVVVLMRGAIKYDDYRGMTRAMERVAEAEGFGRDLILIQGEVFSDHSAGLILNPPALEGPGPLYFRWVEGEDLSALRTRFPGRRVWIVQGSSMTGGPPHVVSGPLP
jgi:4-amino-4-deoxy-L-arabinose transferase-like glycosyltransferase